MTFPLSLDYPGGGTYAFLETAQQLKKAGAMVSIVNVNSDRQKVLFPPSLPSSISGEKTAKSLHEQDITVISLPASRFTFVLDSLSIRKAVNNCLRQHSVDAIISWHHEAAFLGTIANKQKIPLAQRAAGNYTLVLNSPRGWLWSKLNYWLLRRTFQQADIIWANSSFTQQDAIEVFQINPDKVKVVPEGINPLFYSAERHQDETQEVQRFFFFGQWSKRKGLLDTLAAFGDVAAQGKRNWQLQIAGWGDEEALWKTAEQHGIADLIQVVGRLNHPDLLKALKLAQVVILPSHIESFGLAVIESQASGIPVIAYDTGAVPDIIEDSVTGWLVPLNRIDLLTKAILDALAHPAQTYKMGLAGRDRVVQRYSWEHTITQFLEDIKKLKK